MLRVAVLISGGGSNLKSLIDSQDNDYYKIDIVIADRDCGGLNIAGNAGIKAVLLDRKVYKKDLFKKIDEEISNIDLVVLAGFLSIVDSAFIKKWEGKIINIH